MNSLPQDNQHKSEAMNLSAIVGKKSKPKRIYKLGFVVVALVMVVVGGGRFIETKSKANSNSQTLGETTKFIDLNQSLNIPIEATDEENTNNYVVFKLVSAELTKEIILKGQRASATNGRSFLIVNVTLSNPSEKVIKLDTRNYVRLGMSNEVDLSTAQIHNDPVEVQPGTDQQIKLGFSISSNGQNLVLYLSTDRSEKSPIPLDF